MSDRKYLKLRHNTWYFQKRVPKALKPLYPNTSVIEKSLETGDIREARNRRDIILGQLRQRQHLLEVQSEPRRKFRQYVDELRQVAQDGFVGPDVAWDEVLDPETVGKHDDPEYIEAYKVVTQGKTDSERYGPTLKEVLKLLLRESERENLHTPGTRNRFEKSVQNFLLYMNEHDLPLNQISRSSVFDFIEHSRERNSGTTVQGHISRLKSVWMYAYQRGWVQGDNPFEKHRINTTAGRKKKQPFTVEELKSLMSVLSTQTLSMQLLAKMGLYTGARISELVAVKLADFKTEDGVQLFGIAVDTQGKTEAASRWVPIPDSCKALLNQVSELAIEAGSEYLFYDLVSIRPDGRLAYKATKLFGDLKKKHVTDREDKGFHSFRVMMATALQRANVSELEAAYLLGHSRKGLTMSYGYYSKGYNAKRLKEALEKGCRVIDSEFLAGMQFRGAG
ncbi:site-specific integrase [Vibrio alginolyticus]|uniref:site-specific integrase n=1 Tax=Vibrio alginolyticus TaxID=663 RepID=UPI00215C087D|nr:site-specific integrase [Vibrio alginolyticus]EKL9831181.1 site-specific integrase [Vibrio alginolyticus]MCR9489395.1 site-specific integrase [Vibrio alginolyticus]